MSILMNMANYSTAEVSELAGISKRTLYRWLWGGEIPEPKRGRLAGRNFRIWTQRDLNRVLKHKQLRYRKGRGRKKKLKS